MRIGNVGLSVVKETQGAVIRLDVRCFLVWISAYFIVLRVGVAFQNVARRMFRHSTHSTHPERK